MNVEPRILYSAVLAFKLEGINKNVSTSPKDVVCVTAVQD